MPSPPHGCVTLSRPNMQYSNSGAPLVTFTHALALWFAVPMNWQSRKIAFPVTVTGLVNRMLLNVPLLIVLPAWSVIALRGPVFDAFGHSEGPAASRPVNVTTAGDADAFADTFAECAV